MQAHDTLPAGAQTRPVAQDGSPSDAVERIRRMLANPRRTRR